MVAWIVREKVWPSLPVSVHFNSKPGVGASVGTVSVIDRASAAILAWVIEPGAVRQAMGRYSVNGVRLP